MRAEDTTSRIIGMKQYIDGIKLKDAEGYQMTTKEILALADYASKDLTVAIATAFHYGRAKGYKAAKEGK